MEKRALCAGTPARSRTKLQRLCKRLHWQRLRRRMSRGKAIENAENTAWQPRAPAGHAIAKEHHQPRLWVPRVDGAEIIRLWPVLRSAPQALETAQAHAGKGRARTQGFLRRRLWPLFANRWFMPSTWGPQCGDLPHQDPLRLGVRDGFSGFSRSSFTSAV